LLTKKHLFVGFGDIAGRCAAELIASGDHVVGIARSSKPSAKGVELWLGDVKSPDILAQVKQHAFASVVITLTPDAYSEAGYRDTYLAGVEALIGAWQDGHAPGRVIFVSSTSVYGQNEGEWVNESCDTAPTSYSGSVLLEAEKALLNAGIQASIVRFSGIYGPERNYLLRMIRDGKGGSHNYTNCIHIDDCCGVILHLIALRSEQLETIYLASDNEPVVSCVMRGWLAVQLGIDPDQLTMQAKSGRGGSKRCDNSRLLASGYQFLFPSYKAGYKGVLQTFS